MDLLKEADAAARRGTIRQVDPRRIQPSRNQPRTDFDDARLAELADSISANGVLQPLLARERADGTLELLAGERRQRAAIMAGLEQVPVRVLTVDDLTAAAITLTENLAREDLSAWDEAQGLARFRAGLEAAGSTLTRDRLAKIVGRSGGSVSESLQIADRITDEVVERSGVDRRLLTMLPKTALNGIARAVDQKQMIAFLKLAAGRALSREAPGRSVQQAAEQTRGRPRKAFRTADRLRERGTFAFELRRRPEELHPEEARGALKRLEPLIEALRRRVVAASTSEEVLNANLHSESGPEVRPGADQGIGSTREPES